MKQILEPAKGVVQLMGKPATAGPRRLSTLVVQLPCDDGTVLYHTLTAEMLLLDSDETAALDSDEALLDELATKQFVVAQDTDEVALTDQVRTVYALLHKPSTTKTGFTILSTMDCNARCFYCYELGRPRRYMSVERAREVAAYIERACGGDSVSITWFGGEPLMGADAIDTICEELDARGIEYHSRAISNSLLFDEQMVQHARDCWNLGYVQVTLDGTEEVYNQAKAFVDYEGSAFQRVLDNMDHMLAAGIRAVVRLNLHADNIDDMLQLADQLAERFGGKEGFGVYAAILRDNDGDLIGFATGAEAFEAHRRVTARLEELGLASRRKLVRQLKYNRCAADSDRAAIIMPDGRIGKCEHFTETELVGSIDSDEWDPEVEASWKERWPAIDECHSCPCYPICIDLKKCPYTPHPCDEFNRRLRVDELQRQVLDAYRSEVKAEV